MTPGVGPFLTPGAWSAGFIKRTTTHCYIQNMKALGLVVSEKKIFLCFSYDAPGAGAHMDPRGMVGRIYKEDHYTLLLRMGTNGKYAIRILVYIIRMYSNIRIEKSSMFSLRFQLAVNSERR